MMDVLTFNGRSFSEFNTFFDGSKSFGSPQQDIEFVDVPGRNGSLSFFNQRYQDIVIPYPCFIRTGFVANYRALSQYLNSITGFHRLESSKEPDYYRMAAFAGGLEPETTAFNHGGFFEVQFRCHPQRWLKSGESFVNFTANGTIVNQTLFNSKPLIRVYGKGSFIVGDTQITITNADGYTDINCDIMECYKDGLDCSEFVQISGNDYPVLAPGSNQVQLGSGITRIQIMPRWFVI